MHEISEKPAAAPQRLCLGLVAVLGFAFAAIVPPFQVCDEHAHFVRAYEISLGRWIGRSDPALPPDVISAIARYPDKMEWQKKIKPSTILADALGEVGGDGQSTALPDGPGFYWVRRGVIAANVYCPIAYVPAAAGIAIGRALGLPALALLYAGRFGDVLLLVAACALAFRLAPEYWHAIAAVSLLPMTLHQAGGISADMTTIGLAFLLVACLLWLRQHVADTRSLVLVALVFVALVLCKISPWAFAAVLLIPRRAFAARGAWIGYMAGVMAAMLLATWTWQVLSRESLEAFRVVRLGDGVDMSANTSYVMAHPMAFAVSAIKYFARHSPRYLVQFVGAFGWTKYHLPLWVQPLCLLLLVAVAAAEPASKPFSNWERVILAAVFLIGVAFVHVALFIGDSFDGIQGRYFTPFCLFGLLAIRQRKWVLPQGMLTALVLGFGAIHGVASLIWVWGVHYI